MPPVSLSHSTRVIRIRNTTGVAQELWLEPLGDRVILAPNILYELTATEALEEIADLFAFLESSPSSAPPSVTSKPKAPAKKGKSKVK